MSLRSEGEQEIFFYSVQKSLKKIIQNKESNLTSLNNVRFGGKITTLCTRYWSDFSLDTSKEIELWNNGSRQDIIVNDCLFSYLVKGYESWTNSRGHSHNLNIKGCWPNDEEFSFDISIPYDIEELVAIVYAIIIISETKDFEKASALWKLIIKQDYFSNPAQRLQFIIDGETLSKRIIEKHPFMTSVLREGLKYQVEKAKEEISNLEFLK